MELMYKGDLLNEFFKLTSEEKIYLAERDFSWCNSRSISAYSMVGEDTIFRLHNGSLYKFKDTKDWSIKNLSSTIRKDVFGVLIRKNIEYEFVGVLFMDFDCDETDIELLYKYVPAGMIEKTKIKDKYKVIEVEKEIFFYGPSDKTIKNYQFQLTARIENPISLIGLGEIKVLEIIDADWNKQIKVKAVMTNETYSAIKFTRQMYGEKTTIIFTNPKKISGS
jgi:hypothetical protein